MSQNQIHVVQRENGWAAVKSGNERASFIAPTQKEVIARSIQIAKAEHRELFIHGTDGKIRERNSYGNDPFPPRG